MFSCKMTMKNISGAREVDIPVLFHLRHPVSGPLLPLPHRLLSLGVSIQPIQVRKVIIHISGAR